jgi:hypothetical protein
VSAVFSDALIYLLELKLQEEYQKIVGLEREYPKSNLHNAMIDALQDRCNKLNGYIVEARKVEL